ncbi:MAG: helix-turn-helix domain-containing protein [Miltoncostaeaceae bacterium]
MAHPAARDTDLLPVSAAARLLGVSVSSLRAWAAAGRVPHERTPGGHRRFDRAILREWMEARGARVPDHDPSHPVHLVPGRITPRPRAAAAIDRAAPRIADEATALVADGHPRSRRMSTTLRARLLEQADALAHSLATGDLAPCIREAEWRAFRDGAADVPAARPMGEARALARAVERAAASAGARVMLQQRSGDVPRGPRPADSACRGRTGRRSPIAPLGEERPAPCRLRPRA